MAQQRRSGQSNASADASRYIGTGLTWALSTLLFLYLGTLADEWLGTAPWLTLVGAFVGAAAGFWYMYYHLVVAPQREPDQDRKADR
jgi:F0F1-type ATP synthase assembly protein I